jgi:hypothetical protein
MSRVEIQHLNPRFSIALQMVLATLSSCDAKLMKTSAFMIAAPTSQSTF